MSDELGALRTIFIRQIDQEDQVRDIVEPERQAFRNLR